MEKKRLIATALVLVAAIAITLFLTKGYWWPFVYDNLFYAPPYIRSGSDPEQVIGPGGGPYVEKFFTAENISSEYLEPWLVDKNLLKAYARFYYTLENNQTIAKLYIFKYNTREAAKRIYNKSGLVEEELRYIKVKHGPNEYVFQASEFIVYVSFADGFEYVAKDEMMKIYVVIPE